MASAVSLRGIIRRPSFGGSRLHGCKLYANRENLTAYDAAHAVCGRALSESHRGMAMYRF